MIVAKPFLKWAGGKTQLLGQLREYYPANIKNYYEPFLGGGAVFFDIISRVKENIYLSDLNEDLVLTYQSVQKEVELLFRALRAMQSNYFSLPQVDRGNYFYFVRENFNRERNLSIERAAQFIFLNKTCFNGLHRVNQKGWFNVPFGNYNKPKILDTDNLTSVADALDGVSLTANSFEYLQDCEIGKGDFIYLDPPYRPLKKTSFTKYSSEFTDDDQIRLARLFKVLSYRGAKLMLSNSDTDDGFYERYYAGFNIHKVTAKRMINCVGKGRGIVNEVLIKNY